MKRRDFFAKSALLGAGLAVAGTTQGMLSSPVKADEISTKGDLRANAKFRLSSQLGIIPGKNMQEKLKQMKDWGFEAFEVGGGDVGRAKEVKKMADDAGLLISAICWGSCAGDLCSEDESKRGPGKDALKKALEAAGIMGARAVVYVPAFNGQTKLTNQEIRKLLLEFLPEMGKFAAEHGTNVVLEPLCRQEAFFLRQVADGASICRDCNCDGLGVMGDFYHMAVEETDDMGAFISGGKYVKHVHLGNGPQEPRRTLPGQDDRPFVYGFRGLKYIGYEGFCSFECGVKGDNTVEVPKSLEYLKKEWEAA